MRVAVALASSAGQLSGVQRHALNLARALLTQTEITAVNLVAAPWQMDFVRDALPGADERLQLHAADISQSALGRNRWYFRELPRMAARMGADIVHLAYPVPLHIRAFDCPVAVSLHDLYPFDVPENFGFPKVLLNRVVLRQCIRSADAIACVSASTLSRLERMEPLLALAKAVVVPNCVEAYAGRVSEVSVADLSRERFLLCVAQHRRNKNLLLLLRAFQLLVMRQTLPAGMRLVIVGNHGPETQSLQRFLQISKCGSRVLLLEGLSEAELHWCYRRCDLLLAPSAVEGFGLPVAEALLAGCRILCSDIAAFREVGGDCCRYVSVEEGDEARLAYSIEDALADGPRWPVELPHLSATAVGKQYLQLYRGLLAPIARTTASLLRAPVHVSERKSVA
jgi:glycosyltransferase involved in cell wall biosynthesis